MLLDVSYRETIALLPAGTKSRFFIMRAWRSDITIRLNQSLAMFNLGLNLEHHITSDGRFFYLSK